MNHKLQQSIRCALMLVALCGLMLLPGNGKLPVARQQELRVILTARDMVRGGSWVVPHFLGEPRLRKPPLLYWLVAGTFRILDPSTASAAVARLPTAVLGTLLILALYLCGRDVVGRRRALFSALIAMTTYLFMRHARVAETDIPLTLFVLLASWSGYRAMTRTRALGWWLAAGVFTGLGFMIKGPAAIALPLLAWCAYAVATPGVRSGQLALRIVLALVICGLIAAPWYAALFFSKAETAAASAQIGTELDVTFAESHHRGPIFYYVYMLPQTMMPWGLFLPFALVSAWRHARHHRGERFLLGWFGSTFLALSVISSKQEHYSTLLLPASALILGWFALRLRTIPALAAWTERRLLPRLIVFCLFMALASALYSSVVFAWHDPRTVFKAFDAKCEPYFRNAKTIVVVGPHKGVMEYYIGRHLHREEDLSKAIAEAGTDDVIVVTENKEHAMANVAVPRPKVVELRKRDIRCVLYGKPGETAP